MIIVQETTLQFAQVAVDGFKNLLVCQPAVVAKAHEQISFSGLAGHIQAQPLNQSEGALKCTRQLCKLLLSQSSHLLELAGEFSGKEQVLTGSFGNASWSKHPIAEAEEGHISISLHSQLARHPTSRHHSSKESLMQARCESQGMLQSFPLGSCFLLPTQHHELCTRSQAIQYTISEMLQAAVVETAILHSLTHTCSCSKKNDTIW
mmetsp:Transcript_129688/g.307633  ORF Transcript_129688/g.307633 Transcript_129688/m.307633 type:complete len:206 (+) Transcript_129688:266-883(+)